MIDRQQLVDDINDIEDTHIEILHRIIVALKNSSPAQVKTLINDSKNPLKDSITFENDLLSPIDESWDALS